MAEEARKRLSELGLLTIQNINQLVETLSGGQRQGVAVARATSFGTKVSYHGRTYSGSRR